MKERSLLKEICYTLHMNTCVIPSYSWFSLNIKNSGVKNILQFDEELVWIQKQI
jgi:hypothetical protein